MAEEGQRAREHDHLVEPLFAGLGAVGSGGTGDDDDARRSRRRGLLGRLARSLRRWFGRAFQRRNRP